MMQRSAERRGSMWYECEGAPFHPSSMAVAAAEGQHGGCPMELQFGAAGRNGGVCSSRGRNSSLCSAG